MKMLQVYHALKEKVKFLYNKLKLSKYEKTTGRKPAIPLEEILTLSLYKHTQNIKTKAALYRDFKPPCSYKTLVVNTSRWFLLALLIILIILRENRKHAHLIKHTDPTDIPVCLNKNAKTHRTMRGLAEWGHSGKGLFYGLKLHLTCDLHKLPLSIMFTKGNTHGTKVFMKLNKDLDGIFIADAEFVSKKLQEEFYQENKRILFAQSRKNMKKVITFIQKKLYDTRMIIEINFRNHKMFFGLETSLPRSINGYFANYIYSILAYVLR
jgi:hypothetical protein